MVSQAPVRARKSKYMLEPLSGPVNAVVDLSASVRARDG